MPEKLVRDDIPRLIISDGGTPEVRQVSGDELWHALLNKLVEEANEAREAGMIDPNPQGVIQELADVLEVVDALIAHHLSTAAVYQAKNHKRRTRGAFRMGLLLQYHDA